MKETVRFCFSMLSFVAIASLCCDGQAPAFWGMTSAGGPLHAGTLFANYPGGENIQHVFGSDTDGTDPCGSVIQASNGLLYGMTKFGGANGVGMIFSYDTSTGAYTDVHDFGYGFDGTAPQASLKQAANGLLYGTTSAGGRYGWGTIFSYETSAGKYSRLYDFKTDSDAQSPSCSLMQDTSAGGLLYGVSRAGGAYRQGAIFNYNIADSSESIVYSFGKAAISPPEGTGPCGTLIQASNGLLYGMTTLGGTEPVGTIYSFNTGTGVLNTLHNFSSTDTSALMPSGDGYYPSGSLLQASNGLLYGMTTAPSGIIFSYNIQTDTYRVVHYFGGELSMGLFGGFELDGKYPRGSVVEDAGVLFGMTSAGGGSTGSIFGAPVTDSGVLFTYNIWNHDYSLWHTFGGSPDNGSDGATPLGDLLGLGSFPTGIFPPRVTYTQLYVFPNPSSGEFIIQMPSPDIAQVNHQDSIPIEIYNVVGEKVYQAVLTRPENTINMGNQSPGAYFIYLHTGESAATGKVIITR